MKHQIFAVELKESINSKTFDYLIQLVDKVKQESISKLKVKSEKDLSLVGDILARYAMKKAFCIPIDEIKFKIGEYGKPYVVECENVHFNISHSGNFVVCAVYNKPIGIDVQRMDDVDFDSIAKRAFTENEQVVYFSTPEEERKKQFYKTWTAKESYIKCLGTGIRDLGKDIPDDFLVDTFLLKLDYVVSVCSK